MLHPNALINATFFCPVATNAQGFAGIAKLMVILGAPKYVERNLSVGIFAMRIAQYISVHHAQISTVSKYANILNVIWRVQMFA